MFPPGPKRRREPITRDLLLKILPDLPTGRTGLDRDNANVYAAFCVAFAGFMRMGEFTYSAAMASNKGTRPRILRRSDINFAADSNTATLLLRRSKTDINRTGVRIILAATGDAACPVTALRRLFDTDPKVDPDEPLFSFSGNNTAFTRTRVLSRVTTGLRKAGIQDVGFSGHSFRRGAAQHASNMGMLDHEIQLLGRWTSAAFLLYFSHSPSRLRALNHQFQTGVAPSL
jgi:integrase